MEDFKCMKQCFLCSQQFQYGPHLYDGEYIPAYKIVVCMICYKANHDGWASHYEEKIISHLKEKGLPIPDRQEKGYLPRDG